jgi:hypothetical protein
MQRCVKTINKKIPVALGAMMRRGLLIIIKQQKKHGIKLLILEIITTQTSQSTDRKNGIIDN